MNEFRCAVCYWITGAIVALAFLGVLWRNRREKVTRLDLRENAEMRARKNGL